MKKFLSFLFVAVLLSSTHVSAGNKDANIILNTLTEINHLARNKPLALKDVENREREVLNTVRTAVKKEKAQKIKNTDFKKVSAEQVKSWKTELLAMKKELQDGTYKPHVEKSMEVKGPIKKEAPKPMDKTGGKEHGSLTVDVKELHALRHDLQSMLHRIDGMIMHHAAAAA